MGKDVIPDTDDRKVSWAANMILKFPPLSLSLGFIKAESDAFIDDLEMMRFVIVDAQAATLEAKSKNARKRLMLGGANNGGETVVIPPDTEPDEPAIQVEPNIILRVRKMIGRIKRAPGFTAIIGEELDIMPDESGTDDPANAKPSFTTAAQVSGVLLDWLKGDFDGVLIESQRGAEATFTFLDKDIKSPYLDTRPNLTAGQPEKRRYRMIYLLDDQIVGQYSDEVVTATMA